jgi:hypothetical protein
MKHFVVRHNEDETTSSAPATLFFGTITQENGSLLLVSESDRDNGDHQDGDNHDGDDNANNDSARDNSPGGPGRDGHKIVVDTSSATTVELDGAEGAPVVGDEVAVLGEFSDNTVIADAVYGFSNPQSFLRGDIQSISGTTVAIGDGRHGRGHDHGPGGGDNDGTQLVDLGDVPLFVNGSTGSTIDQLAVGDKILVIGAFGLTENTFTPSLAFAFNGHDDHPCGDNGEHHGEGSDG